MSVTDKGIEEGLKGLKEGREYDKLYGWAVGGGEAEWIVGMKGTRGLRRKFNAELWCGGVERRRIGMIAKGEEEIEELERKALFGVTAEVEGVRVSWEDGKRKEKGTLEEDVVKERLGACKGKV
ncbi:hypothetical protein [Bacillus altitudinis]|uniref:hypothetical protein n=1 Tax=Bacillus altitudinis TaxID=293387 RepID=UPI0011A8A73B|nr:hypothetical protein [Bacillus altitudinis]